ncbi:VQ motif-containing protein 8, chloroplastic [Cajanus cajan]|uniref:Protein MKS1 n=1 Tax=Cajanus cajan TaxID=3821 RepID=A0A151RPN0_CAJCA|nr:VQ motif-containing protein 8, chloroplastic [Cajanus cajan]KYP44500.1 Protein MKS1 [Cajanus cajan]
MRPGAKLYEFHEPKKVINGPRPSPLMINKDSHRIRKPSTCVDADTKLNKPQRINPIIIYTHSPKIIHTKAKDFMALVQRLTGRSSTNDDVSTTSLPQEASENFGSSLSDGSNNNSNNETSSALRRGEYDSTNVQRSPSHLDFVDMPLFTPNSSDFFCSSRSMFKYSDSPYGVLGSLISPSALEFIKELPEY